MQRPAMRYSASRLPGCRVALAVSDCDDRDQVGIDPIVHAIREPVEDQAPQAAIPDSERIRTFADLADGVVEFSAKRETRNRAQRLESRTTGTPGARRPRPPSRRRLGSTFPGRHASPDLVPRHAGRTLPIKTIESSIQLSAKLRRKREVLGLEAAPEFVDKIELLVGGEIRDVHGRFRHPRMMPPVGRSRQSHQPRTCSHGYHAAG